MPIRYRISNNSSTTNAVITLFQWNDDAGFDHHADFQTDAGWNAPWNTYSDWTQDDTSIYVEASFIEEIDDFSTTYAANSGTILRVGSNSGVVAGYTISGTGYTAGQTAVSTSGTIWVVTSAGPNSTPIPGGALNFIPPQYELRVNNTVGISPGDIASQNGYSAGQTVVSVASGQWLVMSAPSNGTPTPGGTIRFSQPSAPMTTIAPNSTQTFILNYTNGTSVYGTYTSTVSISGTVGGVPFVKYVRNFAIISNTPITDPESPFYNGGGGGGYTGDIAINDSGGSGGGGGGFPWWVVIVLLPLGKIICTKLHELGYLSDEIFAADQLFGEHLRRTDPHAYYGYIKWASVVVDWMNAEGPDFMFWIRDPEKRKKAQQAMVIRWTRRIATPWAEHMAYKMGVLKEDNRAGRWIMKLGLGISRIIGKSTNTLKPTKSPATAYALWAVFSLFWLIAGVKK